MRIIKQSHNELTKVEIYKLTMSNDTVMIKDLTDGYAIKVRCWVMYEKEADDGSLMTLLALMEEDTETVFVTQSQTFIKSFTQIEELFADEETPAIVKISGKTKSNRDFVNCTI